MVQTAEKKHEMNTSSLNSENEADGIKIPLPS